MGIPVALDLGRRDLAPVVYDARDIYLDARNLARLPRSRPPAVLGACRAALGASLRPAS